MTTIDDKAFLAMLKCARDYGARLVRDEVGRSAFDAPTPEDVAVACGWNLAVDADDATRNAYYEILGELCSACEDSAAEFLASEVAPR